jgi:hypothetical protein
MADFLVYRPRPPRRRGFRIFRTDHGFLVTSDDLESVPAGEVEEALRAAGARAGDEIEYEVARSSERAGDARPVRR